MLIIYCLCIKLLYDVFYYFPQPLLDSNRSISKTCIVYEEFPITCSAFWLIRSFTITSSFIENRCRYSASILLIKLKLTWRALCVIGKIPQMMQTWSLDPYSENLITKTKAKDINKLGIMSVLQEFFMSR